MVVRLMRLFGGWPRAAGVWLCWSCSNFPVVKIPGHTVRGVHGQPLSKTRDSKTHRSYWFSRFRTILPRERSTGRGRSFFLHSFKAPVSVRSLLNIFYSNIVYFTYTGFCPEEFCRGSFCPGEILSKRDFVLHLSTLCHNEDDQCLLSPFTARGTGTVRVQLLPKFMN